MSDSLFASLTDLERARLRARGRVNLQRMGLTKADIPDNLTLEHVGTVGRLADLNAYDRMKCLERGRQLARRFGW